jgi:phosphoserine phosphatase
MLAHWLRFDVVFFDCDSTLTRIEGIDELARLKGQGDLVSDLTRQAMDGERDLESVYAQRLDLLQPSRGELRAIARAYRDAVVEDARATVAALRFLGIDVQVVSGGLLEAVESFAGWLGIDRRRVRAVPLEFDRLAGRWWETWRHRHAGNAEERYLALPGNPLALSAGKAEVIAGAVAGRPWRTLLVGDGVSDLAAQAAVDLFVGYGGVTARARVAAAAPVFITCASLAPVLALAAGPRAAARLAGTPHAALLAKGLGMIRQNRVQFRNSIQREALLGDGVSG